MHRALEDAFADLVLGEEIDPDDPAQVDAWLTEHGVGPEDAEAIKASGLSRMLVYRRLVRNTLTSAVQLAIPRTIARLGERFDL